MLSDRQRRRKKKEEEAICSPSVARRHPEYVVREQTTRSIIDL